MKVWKFGLLSVILSAITVVLIYSSCERNVCNNVTCFNGGSCNVGICKCPLGYEDPQCQTKSVKRYLGVYAGYTTCDNKGYLIDSVWITADPNLINFVTVTYKSIPSKVLRGYVSNTASTYEVVIQDDSAKNYLRQYSLTLQGDKMLKLHTYESNTKPGDTSYHSCMFSGTKQL